jgi:uncharacterized SAM-binding protein YcdF (DUF218 family)
MGSKLNDLRGTETERRLIRGLALWRKGGYHYVLVTGGIFNPSSIQTVPAAILMREYLVAKGVPEHAILCESRARDTYENVANGLSVLREAGQGRAAITVVTQWQHAIRFRLTFRAYEKKIETVPMYYFDSWKDFLREPFFILHHLLFPKGDGSPFAEWNRRRRTQV